VVGIKSRQQDLRWMVEISLETSATVTGSSWVAEEMDKDRFDKALEVQDF